MVNLHDLVVSSLRTEHTDGHIRLTSSTMNRTELHSVEFSLLKPLCSKADRNTIERVSNLIFKYFCSIQRFSDTYYARNRFLLLILFELFSGNYSDLLTHFRSFLTIANSDISYPITLLFTTILIEFDALSDVEPFFLLIYAKIPEKADDIIMLVLPKSADIATQLIMSVTSEADFHRICLLAYHNHNSEHNNFEALMNEKLVQRWTRDPRISTVLLNLMRSSRLSERSIKNLIVSTARNVFTVTSQSRKPHAALLDSLAHHVQGIPELEKFLIANTFVIGVLYSSSGELWKSTFYKLGGSQEAIENYDKLKFSDVDMSAMNELMTSISGMGIAPLAVEFFSCLQLILDGGALSSRNMHACELYGLTIRFWLINDKATTLKHIINSYSGTPSQLIFLAPLVPQLELGASRWKELNNVLIAVLIACLKSPILSKMAWGKLIERAGNEKNTCEIFAYILTNNLIPKPGLIFNHLSSWATLWQVCCRVYSRWPGIINERIRKELEEHQSTSRVPINLVLAPLRLLNQDDIIPYVKSALYYCRDNFAVVAYMCRFAFNRLLIEDGELLYDDVGSVFGELLPILLLTNSGQSIAYALTDVSAITLRSTLADKTFLLNKAVRLGAYELPVTTFSFNADDDERWALCDLLYDPNTVIKLYQLCQLEPVSEFSSGSWLLNTQFENDLPVSYLHSNICIGKQPSNEILVGSVNSIIASNVSESRVKRTITHPMIIKLVNYAKANCKVQDLSTLAYGGCMDLSCLDYISFWSKLSSFKLSVLRNSVTSHYLDIWSFHARVVCPHIILMFDTLPLQRILEHRQDMLSTLRTSLESFSFHEILNVESYLIHYSLLAGDIERNPLCFDVIEIMLREIRRVMSQAPSEVDVSVILAYQITILSIVEDSVGSPEAYELISSMIPNEMSEYVQFAISKYMIARNTKMQLKRSMPLPSNDLHLTCYHNHSELWRNVRSDETKILLTLRDLLISRLHNAENRIDDQLREICSIIGLYSQSTERYTVTFLNMSENASSKRPLGALILSFLSTTQSSDDRLMTILIIPLLRLLRDFPSSLDVEKNCLFVKELVEMISSESNNRILCAFALLRPIPSISWSKNLRSKFVHGDTPMRISIMRFLVSQAICDTTSIGLLLDIYDDLETPREAHAYEAIVLLPLVALISPSMSSRFLYKLLYRDNYRKDWIFNALTQIALLAGVEFTEFKSLKVVLQSLLPPSWFQQDLCELRAELNIAGTKYEPTPRVMKLVSNARLSLNALSRLMVNDYGDLYSSLSSRERHLCAIWMYTNYRQRTNDIPKNLDPISLSLLYNGGCVEFRSILDMITKYLDGTVYAEIFGLAILDDLKKILLYTDYENLQAVLSLCATYSKLSPSNRAEGLISNIKEIIDVPIVKHIEMCREDGTIGKCSILCKNVISDRDYLLSYSTMFDPDFEDLHDGVHESSYVIIEPISSIECLGTLIEMSKIGRIHGCDLMTRTLGESEGLKGDIIRRISLINRFNIFRD